MCPQVSCSLSSCRTPLFAVASFPVTLQSAGDPSSFLFSPPQKSCLSENAILGACISDDRCSDFQDSCSVFLQLGGLSLSVRI